MARHQDLGRHAAWLSMAKSGFPDPPAGCGSAYWLPVWLPAAGRGRAGVLEVLDGPGGRACAAVVGSQRRDDRALADNLGEEAAWCFAM